MCMSESGECEARQARQKWNARYRHTTRTPNPARVLLENQHLLPSAGCALDLACGLGGNALVLAEHGLETWGWDISDVVVARVRRMARQRGVSLHVEARDVVACPPSCNSFDVIVVSHFLERNLVPALIQALTPGGLLFYQTSTRSAGDPGGPTQPVHRLALQELLSLFRTLHVLVYREEGGRRNLRPRHGPTAHSRAAVRRMSASHCCSNA